jgi:hypothetical protein
MIPGAQNNKMEIKRAEKIDATGKLSTDLNGLRGN